MELSSHRKGPAWSCTLLGVPGPHLARLPWNHPLRTRELPNPAETSSCVEASPLPLRPPLCTERKSSAARGRGKGGNPMNLQGPTPACPWPWASFSTHCRQVLSSGWNRFVSSPSPWTHLWSRLAASHSKEWAVCPQTPQMPTTSCWK